MADSSGRDKVLEFIKEKGAILPIQISRELSVDTMFSGAMLSELVHEGKIKVSEHLRVGGSPVYYIDESKLENYTRYLNEKDVGTVIFLKEKEVISDVDCTPLQRVSFRIVKDFAKKIVLKKDDGNQEVFWRYFLVEEEVAKDKILDLVKEKPTKETTQKEEVSKKEPENIPKEEVKKFKKEIIGDVVKEFFRINEVTVWEEKVIRKGKDVNYIVSFESKVGDVKYFAKYRDKKRISEGDISLAYNEAGKLPLMFLTKGELTLPAKRLIKNDFKGVIFKKIGK